MSMWLTLKAWLKRNQIICPDQTLPAKFITRDHKRINRTINLGYKQVDERYHEIKQFVGS